MAEDLIKPTGATRASKNDAGGGNIRPEPVIGIVKNNVDAVRAGRIQVYIQDLNGNDPDDAKNWMTVRYLSPFYGRTYGNSSSTGYGEYPSNPISYGMWNSPPDIGTKVICVFVNGDMNYGYYIGCIPEPEALTMVPAIGAVKSKVIMNSGESQTLSGATQLPVTNLNTSNKNLSQSSGFLDAAKPVHSYVASTLSQQGLIRDPIRGPITSSAQRETPSRVGWGISTPGRPIYEGGHTDDNIANATEGRDTSTKIVSRRAGHSFVMDDGDIVGKDQLVRIRTSLGHQILMSDDGQCLFIIHANGQSWVELGKEGTIDMFATNSVNIRTQGDLNLHADNNINFHAQKDINFNSQENTHMVSKKEFTIRTETNFKQHTLADHTVKVNGQMSHNSSGDAGFTSGGTAFINGSKVNLNTGSIGLTPAEVPPIPLVAQTDTLFDSSKGFAPAPGKLQTIVSRAPAHMPWANAGQGVDLKTTQSAADSLPSAPSESVDAVNNAVPATPEIVPSVAASAVVPNMGAASPSIDPATTSMMVGAAATQAQAAASTVTKAGMGIVDGAPKVGQLAQNAEQLVEAGVLKPGAANLINGLVQKGVSVTGAMTPNMFTGQAGAQNLDTFVGDTAAQVKAQVTTFTAAQEKLVSTGLITGKESASAIAGTVLSSAQNGLAQTTNFIKNSVGTVTNALASTASGISNKLDSVAQSISTGNFASKLSGSMSSGLGSLSATLNNAADTARGAVASAFSAVTSAYKDFKPNVPVDLKSVASSQGSSATETADPYAGLTPEQIDKLGGADPTDPYIRSRLGLPSLGGTTATASSIGGVDVTSAIGQAASSAKGLAASAGGLAGIVGGAGAINAVVNKAAGAPSTIPGVGALGDAIKNGATAAVNNISTQVASATNAVNNLVSATSSSATSNLTNLLSNGTKELASVATSMLPPAAGAQLNAAINAIASSSPGQTKLPAVGLNTNDRAPLTSQVNTIIENKKIPPPNYTRDAEGDAVTSEIDKLQAARQARKAQQAEFDAQFAIAKAAKERWVNAANTLPPGDPQIAELRKEFETEYMKSLAISEKLLS